jgi:hypothetical protein
MGAYLEAVLGFAILGGAIWLVGLLLKRLLHLDTVSAVLLSAALAPLIWITVAYLWLLP